MGKVRAKFTAVKVPRQCPLVLLLKVGWRVGKTFGCEEIIGIEGGAEREVEQSSTAFNENSEFTH
jgi:hypothetical protein